MEFTGILASSKWKAQTLSRKVGIGNPGRFCCIPGRFPGVATRVHMCTLVATPAGGGGN